MNDLELWLQQELRRKFTEFMEIETAMWLHEEFWGVPVGPTLSMVEWSKNDYRSRLSESANSLFD